MSKVFWLLGGAVLGAAGLGLAAYLTDKCDKSSSSDSPCLDDDDETSQAVICENASDDAQAEASA